MKSGLFWKLLLAFWVVFFIISQLFWVLVTLPAADRTRVEIVPLSVQPVSAQPTPATESDAVIEREQDGSMFRVPVIEHMVRGPDGTMFRVRYHYEGARRFLAIPIEPLILALVFGPIFGAGMAWYLVAPIRRLRRGFERLAAGDLSVRLAPGMGGRHDEIADLAQDFDVMAIQLERSIQGREQLLHDVSHELRSPLSRLQLAIGLARQDPNRVEASLNRIEYEGRRLHLIVRELLSLARAEGGHSPGEDYFDLTVLLESVLADARFEAEAAGVTILSEVDDAARDDEAPSLRGHTELVRWALDNVVRNALRFSTSGQSVHVKLAYDKVARRYEIDVVDEGPGAPESALPTLFEPFVRADETSPGFGLGLAVAKRAVTAQGGTIEASNRAGAGLGVHITLPCRPTPLSNEFLVPESAD